MEGATACGVMEGAGVLDSEGGGADAEALFAALQLGEASVGEPELRRARCARCGYAAPRGCICGHARLPDAPFGPDEVPCRVCVLQHPRESSRHWSSTRLLALVLQQARAQGEGASQEGRQVQRFQDGQVECQAERPTPRSRCEDGHHDADACLYVHRGRRWRQERAPPPLAEALDAVAQGRGPRPLLLFPYPEARPAGEAIIAAGAELVAREGESTDASGCHSPLLIVLDGTWAEVREMHHAMPWLREACACVRLCDNDELAGSALRKESPGLTTTTDAVAAAFSAAGGTIPAAALRRAGAALAERRNAFAENGTKDVRRVYAATPRRQRLPK